MKLMKKLFLSAGLWIAIAALAMAQPLERSTPADEGVDAKAVAQFFDSLMHIPQTEIHHAMVVRHGKVIGELHPAPYRAQDAHTLYSESKTVAALAVGLCMDRHLLRLSDRLITFFPEQLPDSISPYLADITIRDLLTMQSGIKPDWNLRNHRTDWVRQLLSKEVTFAPGTTYQYDSMCTYLLSAIVQRTTGKTLMQLLTPAIFQPLGITDAAWEECPHGINTGGWGLRLSTDSQAKIGQLLLQKGKWNGVQLLSKEWVEAAISPQVFPYQQGTAAHTKSPGYGYQIWMSEHPGSYRADGAFGQYVVMIPDHDMVVVINGVSYQTPYELKYIWSVLLPGVKTASLAPDTRDQQRLDALCQKASLPMPAGKATAKKYHGKTEVFGNSKTKLSLSFHSDGTLQFTFGGRTLTATRGQWHYETGSQQPPYSINAIGRFKGLSPDFTSASAYAWQGNELTIRTHWVDFISSETIKVKWIDASNAEVSISRNYDKQAGGPQRVSYTLE